MRSHFHGVVLIVGGFLIPVLAVVLAMWTTGHFSGHPIDIRADLSRLPGLIMRTGGLGAWIAFLIAISPTANRSDLLVCLLFVCGLAGLAGKVAEDSLSGRSVFPVSLFAAGVGGLVGQRLYLLVRKTRSSNPNSGDRD